MNKIKLISVVSSGVLVISLAGGCKKSEKSVETHPDRKTATATIGMQAPPLQIAHWIKGNPVDIAAGKGKKIFVVEFWATWCPPCKVTIPHLTEIQKKYADKDVVIVGITDEDVNLVRQFVSRMGAKMDYVVAVDDNGKTSKAYMEAFEVETIPHAFIIDKSGRIVWQGNPLEEFDDALEAVVAGNFSIEKEIKKNIADRKFREFIDAVDREDTNRIQLLGKELEQLDNEVGGFLPGRKFKSDEVGNLIRFSKIMNVYRSAIMSGRPDSETEEIAKEAAKLAPKEINFEELKNNLKLQKAAMDYFQAIAGGEDDTKIASLSRVISQTKCTNSVLLSQIAWAIMTNEKLNKRYIPLALNLARSAYENSSKNDEDIIQIYARALFENGQKEEAIKYQRAAIEICKDNDKKREFEKTLQQYQEK